MPKFDEIYDKDTTESTGWAVYPKESERSTYMISPDSHLVIPDLNANYVFLVHCLLRHDLIEIKKGTIPYNGKNYECNEEDQFKMLARIQENEQNNLNLMIGDKLNPSLFQSVGEKNGRALFQLKDFKQITQDMDVKKGQDLSSSFMCNFDTVRAIFQNITFKKGKIKGLKLIGDELCDRIGDDIKVLFLLDRLNFLCKANKIDLSFVFSNHTLTFFQKYLNTKNLLLNYNVQYSSIGYWNANGQHMGVQDERFFVTQSSYLLMCFQLGIIGTFGHTTSFLEDSIDRIIRSSYVPNISIMELYADELKRKILISHAPIRWSHHESTKASNNDDISLRNFLWEYNEYAKAFNLRVQNLNPMEQLSEKLLPIIDLSKSLQSICCDLNRVFRDYDSLSHLVLQFPSLESFVFDRALQTSPFPGEVINLFGHNGVLTRNNDFYCCIDSVFAKVSSLDFLNKLEPAQRNLRVAFLRLKNDSLDINLNEQSAKKPENPFKMGSSPLKSTKRKAEEQSSSSTDHHKLFKSAGSGSSTSSQHDRESHLPPIKKNS